MKALKAIGKYFKDFGVAFAKGDIWVKLSAVIMGAGYFARKQIINGILITLVQVGFIVLTMMFSTPALAKF